MSGFGISLGVVALLFAGAAPGQDAGAVKTAVESHWAAINKGDFATIAAQHTPDFSGFFADGGVLLAFESADSQRHAIEAFVASGYKTNWSIRHLEISMYGNTAVATLYLVGSQTQPGRSAQQGTLRVSEVWVKQGNEWKEAHHHDSWLLAAHPE